MDLKQTDVFQRVHDLQIEINYTFQDKSLLVRALTHRSTINESSFLFGDNERLEFLGDAAIDLIVADLLYHRFPEQREGQLTAMRARLVCTETLARLARQIHLDDYVLMGKGEMESGGNRRDATLCATFEALSGAIYLDSDITALRSFLMRFFEPELQILSEGKWQKNAKSRLQELAQARWNITPTYKVIDSSGPDHAKTFTVEVQVQDKAHGIGTGHSKQKAAQAAAEAALQYIAEHHPS